jgi:quinol monooxygenase YgiN
MKQKTIWTQMAIATSCIIVSLIFSIPVKGQSRKFAKDLGIPIGQAATLAMLTRYEAEPNNQQALRSVLNNYVKYANQQAGNIMVEAYYEEEHPTVLWTIERWTSKAEFDKISKGSIFKTLLSIAKNTKQPVSTIYIKDLEPLSKKQWRRTANKEDQPITIMLFVESKPGTEGDFKKVYHTAMPQFRSEPGVINYQLSEFENDKTKFVTYEKFRNENAFQYHLKFPPIKPVIDYLNTSIKRQPFQVGLHKLISLTPQVNKL